MRKFILVWGIGLSTGIAINAIMASKTIEGLRNANQTLLRESMNCGADLTEMEHLNKICNLEYME